jgi:hypothetical protein
MELIIMSKENENKIENFDQILEEEKKFNPEDPCDPSHPDYPWVPCGVKKDKKDKSDK